MSTRARRLLARAIAMLALVSIVGAGTATGRTPGGTTALAAARREEGDARQVTLVQAARNGPFAVTMACGARHEAERQGVDLRIVGSPSWASVETQYATIEEAIAGGNDALTLQPADPIGLEPMAAALAEAGITLVLVDTGLATPEFAASSVRTDNERGGRLAARRLARAIDGRGTVLVLRRDRRSTSVAARLRGFARVMDDHPGITVDVLSLPHRSSPARDLLLAYLAATPDLAGVFATSGRITDEVIDPLAEVGSRAVIVGFDSRPQSVEALRDGRVRALVAQDPWSMGIQGVRQAAAAVGGDPVRRWVHTDLKVLTRSNVDDPSSRRFLYRTTCP